MLEKFIGTYVLMVTPIATTVAVTGDAPTDETAMLAIACFLGGFISGLFSLRQSRRKKEHGYDAAINVIIAILGGVSLGFFASMGLKATTIGFLQWAKDIYSPLTGFIMALSGSQFIEYIMGGGLIRWFKRKTGDTENG